MKLLWIFVWTMTQIKMSLQVLKSKICVRESLERLLILILRADVSSKNGFLGDTEDDHDRISDGYDHNWLTNFTFLL